jgi:hypothetical protein
MLHLEFLKCLTTGSWQLLGHNYNFTNPAFQKYGYYTVDGRSEAQLSFEVSYEDSFVYLYLNVDRKSTPSERYRVLYNYCGDRISMIYEILKEDATGYELPDDVEFKKAIFQKVVVKAPQKEEPKTWAYTLGEVMHGLFRRSAQIFN